MNNFPKVEKKFGRLSRIEQVGEGTVKILIGAALAAGLTLAGEMQSDAKQTISAPQKAASTTGNAITLTPPPQSDMAGNQRIAMHESHRSHYSHRSHFSSR